MIVTRFAPSPTGFLHIGNLRTALYSFLYAKRFQGTFFLRVEDTDQSRYVEGALESLLRTLKACQIQPDAGARLTADGHVEETGADGPYTQSHRLPIYQTFAQQLVEQGHAYRCFCSTERLEAMREAAALAKQTPKYDRLCAHLSKEEVAERVARGESHVIRLHVPEGETVFEDLIRGSVRFDHKEVDDQVLLKSDGFPTYHLAVVVDDHLMHVTHVIRGEEWLSSTPKHLILYRQFGWEPPAFAHLPLILNPDRSKLSKRQGDVAVEDYLKKGYLPEALVNFIALIGWNPTADQELFSLDELIAAFDVRDVNKAGGVFNREKLDWMNAQHLKRLSLTELRARVAPLIPQVSIDEASLMRILEVERERLITLAQINEKLPMYIGPIRYPKTLLVWKKSTTEEAQEALQRWMSFFTDVNEGTFASVASLDQAMREHINQNGWQNGAMLWPLRIALSGLEHSPSPFELAYVLQRNEVLKRLKQASE